MQLVRSTGFSWKDDWFTDAIFPKDAVPLDKLNMQTYALENLYYSSQSYLLTNEVTELILQNVRSLILI
jgi:hypothetical protein